MVTLSFKKIRRETVNIGFQGNFVGSDVGTLFSAEIQALNTVLAFVSSRKQLATSFPTVRSSVENIIKRYRFGTFPARFAYNPYV